MKGDRYRPYPLVGTSCREAGLKKPAFHSHEKELKMTERLGSTEVVVAYLNQEIRRLTAARDAVLGTTSSTQQRRTAHAPKRRVFSAAARRNMSRAQQARWARTRGGK